MTMKNQNAYQPKTGEPCHCRKGQQRDNCPDCEGTGQRIDFARIRARAAEAAKGKPWHETSTGNHQGLIVDEAGANIAVAYDKANARLIAAAPCHHWAVTMAGICNDCSRTFEISTQAADVTAAREVNNARIIENFKTAGVNPNGYLPGMGESEAE